MKIQVNDVDKELHIPPSSDPVKDHQFGAFSCQISSKDAPTQVITLKQSSPQNAELISLAPYVRAHIGQNISLHMSKTANEIAQIRLVWRHKGVKVTRGTDSLRLDIFPVTPKDAGIYELFYEGRRKLGRHGIARLVVTQCPANRYGIKCHLVCPLCLNGGICHEISGQCLCPPGFGGENCQNPCGANKLGPTCSWECNTNEINDGCSKFLICLPDPLSCTCASGYMGSDCTQQCPSGRFGANCLQICQCVNEQPCDPTSGACVTGCRDGWQGPSCQVPELESVQQLKLFKTPSPHKVRMTWSRTHPSFATSYTIEYRFVGKELCATRPTRTSWQLATTSDLQITLENLEPFSQYEFYITANSTLGTSKTKGGIFITDPSAPVGFPSNLTFESFESTVATLSWAPVDCEQSEGVIETYETEIWLLPESIRGHEGLKDARGIAWTVLETSKILPTRLNSSLTRIRIDGLAAYHYYAFRVRARTAVGSGPWSDGIVFVTEYSMVPPPRLMLIEKSAHTLSVGVASMDVPSELVRRIKLRLWAVSMEFPVESEVDLEANRDFAVHNYTFHKLVPSTTYLVRAKMAADVGWGNWSSVLSLVTDETYPSAPSVSLLRTDSSYLVLVLHPPITSNGIILKYKVRVAGSRSSGVTPIIPVISVPPGAGTLNYTVKNLVPASWYQISAQAATSVGWGNWSETFETWTNEGVPEAPSSLRLISANGTSLLVKWTPPSQSYGKVTGYELSCNPRSSLNTSIIISQLRSQSFPIHENINEFLITHLEPLTKYNVEIRASNAKFQGHHTSKIFMTGIPSPISLECFPDSATETTIPVHISALDLPLDLITFYQVIVEDGDKEIAFNDDNLSGFEVGKDFYVALQVDGSQITPYGLLVYVGDDRKYSGYWNTPLSTDKLYRFRLRVVAFDGQTNYSSYSMKTTAASTSAIQPAAQRAVGNCLIYDPQCFWFPFSVVGFSICALWLVASIITFKYCLFKKPVQKQIPSEKEPGSCNSITWSVAVR
uniref:Uncharacterized protein n=1 Tax=Strigamia maritima TaxID=126957 RepID=T1J6Q5_STRMM